MSPILKHIQTKMYMPANLVLTHFNTEKEGRVYEACRFSLNDKRVICRTAKITPRKIGQFVTFWQRNTEGDTEPFCEADDFDFYVINVSKGECVGQFVIPKAVGITKGLVTTMTKEGKRGFRVYPPWDEPQNKQGQRTQAWQLTYFIPVIEVMDSELVKTLFS